MLFSLFRIVHILPLRIIKLRNTYLLFGNE